MNLIKSVSSLAFANGVAQLAQLIAQPYLSRIYSSDQFGVLAQFTFISATLSIFGTLQIHNYLVLTKDKESLRRMTGIGITLTNIVCIIALPFLLKWSSAIYGQAVMVESAILTCLLVMTTCYGNMLRGIQTAVGDFRYLMLYVIVRTIALITTQIVFGIMGEANGLIYGLLCAEFSSQIIIGLKYCNLIKNFSISEIFSNSKKIFREQADFIYSGSFQELISIAAFMLPLYLFSRLYGNMNGGQFAMAYKMAWAPILLMTQSVSPVFLKYASTLESHKLRKSKYLNLKASFAFLLLLSEGSWFIVTPLFLKIFGENWTTAASMCALMSVHSISFLCSLSYRICYRVLNGQRIQLYIDSVALTLTVFIFSQYSRIDLMLMVELIVAIGVLQNIFISILAKKYLFSSKMPGI